MYDKTELYNIIRGYAYKRCQYLKGEDKEMIDEYISIAYLDFLNHLIKNYDESKGKLITYVYKILNLNSFLYFIQAKYHISHNTAKNILDSSFYNKKVKELSDDKKKEKLQSNLKVFDVKSLSISLDSIDILEDTKDEDRKEHFTFELQDMNSEKQFEQIYNRELLDNVINFVNNLKYKSDKSKLIFLDYIKGIKQSDIAKKYNCSRQCVNQNIFDIKNKIKKKFCI